MRVWRKAICKLQGVGETMFFMPTFAQIAGAAQKQADTLAMTFGQKLNLAGADYYPAALAADVQHALLEEVRAVVRAAPLFSPLTPWGKPMRVRMTSAGELGWYSDRSGYRYIRTHPSGMPWPAIPPMALRIWKAVSGTDRTPECCLVNFYSDGAKMGLHQDKDETDFTQPVVSISLGEDAEFRIGGAEKGGATQAIRLRSGDIIVMKGEARLAYHGITKIYAGSSTLLPKGGRINLTLRVVS